MELPSLESFDREKYLESEDYQRDLRLVFEALNYCRLQQIPDSPHRFMWNSLTEHYPVTPPHLLMAVIRLWSVLAIDSIRDADLIYGEEDRGATLTTMLSIIADKPFAQARWCSQPRSDRPTIPLVMEYHETTLKFDGLRKEEAPQKLLVNDDLISTGGTMISTLRGIMRQTEHQISEVLLVADKGYGGEQRLLSELGITPIVIAQLDLNEPRSRVASFNENLPHADQALAQFYRNWRPRLIDNGTETLIVRSQAELARTEIDWL